MRVIDIIDFGPVAVGFSMRTQKLEDKFAVLTKAFDADRTDSINDVAIPDMGNEIDNALATIDVGLKCLHESYAQSHSITRTLDAMIARIPMSRVFNARLMNMDAMVQWLDDNLKDPYDIEIIDDARIVILTNPDDFTLFGIAYPA